MVLVAIKAVKELKDVHWAQALNYLKAYRLEVGLPINFGSKSLTFKWLNGVVFTMPDFVYFAKLKL